LPADVLKSHVTGKRLGASMQDKFTGHFQDSHLTGGTGVQYVIPNAELYLEPVIPKTSGKLGK
jgi:hypothetical protein